MLDIEFVAAGYWRTAQVLHLRRSQEALRRPIVRCAVCDALPGLVAVAGGTAHRVDTHRALQGDLFPLASGQPRAIVADVSEPRRPFPDPRSGG